MKAARVWWSRPGTHCHLVCAACCTAHTDQSISAETSDVSIPIDLGSGAVLEAGTVFQCQVSDLLSAGFPSEQLLGMAGVQVNISLPCRSESGETLAACFWSFWSTIWKGNQVKWCENFWKPQMYLQIGEPDPLVLLHAMGIQQNQISEFSFKSTLQVEDKI